jgi:hypothetical protein
MGEHVDLSTEMVDINVYVLLVIVVHDVKLVCVLLVLFWRLKLIYIEYVYDMVFVYIGDPCAQNPCLNGGQCVPNSFGGFTCTCIPPYSGQRCEDCE